MCVFRGMIDDEDLDRIEALERELVQRQDVVNRALQAHNDMRQRQAELLKDFEVICPPQPFRQGSFCSPVEEPCFRQMRLGLALTDTGSNTDGEQDEKQTTFAITADMTRQYKSMQEELMRRINTLETTIMEQKDQLELARQVSFMHD